MFSNMRLMKIYIGKEGLKFKSGGIFLDLSFLGKKNGIKEMC